MAIFRVKTGDGEVECYRCAPSDQAAIDDTAKETDFDDERTAELLSESDADNIIGDGVTLLTLAKKRGTGYRGFLAFGG